MMKVVEKMLDWENAGKTNLLSVGYSLREPQLLFRKIEDAEIRLQVEKLNKNKIVTEAEKQNQAAARSCINRSANHKDNYTIR